MLKGVIVDDEKTAIDMLKNILENSHKINVVKIFDKASDAMKEIPKLNIDVVFLNTKFPEMSGIELARKLKELNDNIEIVFVTEYNEHAVEAFRINAADYLLKSMVSIYINETIERLIRRNKIINNKNKLMQDIPKIYCFGAFDVYGSLSKDPIKWRTLKSKELFAYLFQNQGKYLPKWKICNAIWPELSTNKVDTQLHTTIYKIKKTLSLANINVKINFTNGNYIMKLPKIYCDIDEFNKIINQGINVTRENVNMYERALSIYKDNYLEEYEYLWSIYVKDEYIQKFKKVAIEVIDFYKKEKNLNKAVEISKRAIKVLPFDERFHEILLKLYIEKKDKVSFLKHYDILLKIFRIELGIEPDYNIKQLYKEII